MGQNSGCKLSKIGADFIKGFEALAFLCPDGKIRAYNAKGCHASVNEWTIGFGIHSGTTKDSIYESESEAIDDFYQKADKLATTPLIALLNKYNIQIRLSQNQFDALADLKFHGAPGLGNLIKKISTNGIESITQSDFINTSSVKHQDRRIKDYKLWSGESISVGTYGIYVNKENDTDGWCHYTKKTGGSSYSTPSGGYGEDMVDKTPSSSDSSKPCINTQNTDGAAVQDSKLLSNEISGRQDMMDQSLLQPVGEGKRLFPKDPTDMSGQFMIAPAADAFNRMSSDARSAGLSLTPNNSTFRSFKKQQELYNKPHTQGAVATPGKSKHGWGRAVDIVELGGSLYSCPTGGLKEKVFAWMKANASNYGFMHPTWADGNCFEPWHWEYIGVDSNPAIRDSTSGDSGVDNSSYASSSGFSNCKKDNTGANSDLYTMQETIAQWKAINAKILGGASTDAIAQNIDGPATTKDVNTSKSTADDGMKTITDAKHPKDDVVISKETNSEGKINEND